MGNKDGKVMGISQFSDNRITVFELTNNYAQNTVLQIMVQVISAIISAIGNMALGGCDS